MVLDVKNILKLQADQKTLLQFNRIEAFRALRVRVGEIWAGDHTGPLSKEIVMAFHCGKHTKAKWHTKPWPQQLLSYLLLYDFPVVPRGKQERNHYPHFENEETEGQWEEVIYSRSHTSNLQSQDSKTVKCDKPAHQIRWLWWGLEGDWDGKALRQSVVGYIWTSFVRLFSHPRTPLGGCSKPASIPHLTQYPFAQPRSLAPALLCFPLCCWP